MVDPPGFVLGADGEKVALPVLHFDRGFGYQFRIVDVSLDAWGVARYAVAERQTWTGVNVTPELLVSLVVSTLEMTEGRVPVSSGFRRPTSRNAALVLVARARAETT